ncbi:siderophore-interacting protein [Actinophytocola xanthii]|uniref:NADPH-dependent ferric siderophore reductase n=1 Tax=Actinophytocola xanthii TaxID=1912961 RepID=A0A1Q8CPF3_9PSEU|nr:siderophore-interacting protein [Actinophytocola xanthii]OLF16249.1 NADPH-dependent ferric siderophore reductase [Actinophytocola xanthii]
MAERPRRRTPRQAEVRRVERLTPHMTRVVLGGPGLDGFGAGEYTDHYVKLLFPGDDPERPRMRTYTVRRWDAQAGELWLDVLVHGDAGVAGPWAAQAKPGDTIQLLGPGGDYAPRADVDWHLLAGDESALPAIAASLERMPADARAHVFIEVEGPEEEQKLEAPADATIIWLHRGDAPAGSALVPAVTALAFPAGTGQAFVHGEAGFVKELRRLLLVERALPRADVSISGYWRLGHDEDRWQATKRDWNRQVEEEQGVS